MKSFGVQEKRDRASSLSHLNSWAVRSGVIYYAIEKVVNHLTTNWFTPLMKVDRLLGSQARQNFIVVDEHQ